MPNKQEEKDQSRRSGVKSIASNSVTSSQTLHSNYTFVHEMDVTDGDRGNKRAGDEAVAALTFAISMQRNQLGPNNSAIIPTLCALGKAYFKRRQYNQSVEAYEECLRLRKSQLEQKGSFYGKGMADILNRLGNVRYKQAIEIEKIPPSSTLGGKQVSPMSLLKQAMKRYQSALLIHKRMNNNGSTVTSRFAEKPDEAYILENIGNVYCRLKQYKEALECFTLALRFWSTQPKGSSAIQMANTLTYIGDLHKMKGEHFKSENDYKLSLEAYTNALQIRPKQEDIDTVKIYDNMAEVTLELKDFRECLRSCDESLRIKLTLLGLDHVNNAKTLYVRACALSGLSDFKMAYHDYQRCVKIQLTRLQKREIDFAALTKGQDALENESLQHAILSGDYDQVMSDLIKDYFEISKTYRSMVDVCKQQGDLSAALVASKSHLNYSKLLLGENNPDLGVIIDTIGVLQFDLGNLDEAMNSFKEVLRLRKLKYGRYHLAIASTKNNIGNVLNAKKQLLPALSMYNDALNDFMTISDNYPQTVAIMDNIASIHTKLYDFKEAKTVYEESLKLKKMHLGNVNNESDIRLTHNNIAASLKYIGIIYYHEKKWVEALKCFEEALDEKVLASLGEDIESAEISFNMGKLYSLLKNVEKAANSYRRSLRIKRLHLGDCKEVRDIEETLNNLNKI